MNLLKPAERRNGLYQNPVPTSLKMPPFFTALRRLLFGGEERVPRRPLGPFRTDTSVFSVPPASGLRVTWLGHSSLLVEMDGHAILIDPVFSERASMVQWAGPRRFFPPPLTMEELPPITAVLLTHDHYDHLDSHAVRALGDRAPLFVCSAGVGSHLRRWGVRAPVQEMDWMDELVLPASASGGLPLTLTALPARHFSGRSLKRFRTLWSSFVLRTERHNFYHGADSGYYDGFCEIGERFGPFDLATLEIGAFDPMWHQIHLGPDNALRAARDLNTRVLMPIHWGLFSLAFHAWYQPIERMVEIAGSAGVPLFVPEPGRPVEFKGASHTSDWWRPYLPELPRTTLAQDAPDITSPDVASPRMN